MHGVSRSLVFNFDLARSITTFNVQPTASPSPIYRMRNLLRPPQHNEKFAAGGLVDAALNNNPAPLRQLMAKLSARIGREVWTTPLEPDLEAADNPHIPAGYTYLLQLVGHDLVHSSVSLAGSATGAVGLANTRLFPLSLETIYGGGPDVCPHPYEIDQAHRDNIGIVPRTRFRTGQHQNMLGQFENCPFHDIARAIPAHVNDSGLTAAEKLDLSHPGKPWWTEALVADARNDDHALISQLTGVFHALHNRVLDMIPVSGALAAAAPAEQAYRRFICARFVVTLIYRNILRKDLLPLILHPDVHQRYTGANPPRVDNQYPGTRDAIPVEFVNGAFRFGHAMVRDSYRVNRDEPLSSGLALRQSSIRNPAAVPVNTDWVVDWSRFFKIADRTPNHSHRIGPVYAGSLRESQVFPALTSMDWDGLPDRDLVTASYSGLWSVPALCAELRSRGLGTILPDYAEWKPALRAWLSKPAAADPAPFTPADIDILVDDPPLTLFLLVEAGQPISNATPSINSAAGESLHLGALGSIIVAETILGVLGRSPIAFEDAGPNLRDRIGAASLALLGDGAVLAGIPEIATMPDLLNFMIASGVLPPPRPDQ